MKYLLSLILISGISLSDNLLLAQSSTAECQVIEMPSLFSSGKQLPELSLVDLINKSQNTGNKTNLDSIPNITLPIVVHIIYDDGDTIGQATNKSDASIRAMIDQINLEFRLMHNDTGNIQSEYKDLAIDTRIEFCLAQRDLNDQPTNGITRRAKSSLPSVCWGNLPDDAACLWQLLNYDNWLDGYINLWFIKGYSGGATLTTGTGTPGFMIVMNHTYVTTGNLVTSVVHELGHALGIAHLDGDGNCANDGVGDTPLQNRYTTNQGCSTKYSTCGGQQYLDMTDNYMAYSGPPCRRMFTQGQSERMYAWLNLKPYGFMGNRNAKCLANFSTDASLISLSGIDTLECGSLNPIIKIKNVGNNNLVSLQINYQVDDNPVQTQIWTGNLSLGATANINRNIIFTPNGQHQLKVFLSDPNNGVDDYLLNDTLVKEFNAPSLDFDYTINGNQVVFTSNFSNNASNITWNFGGTILETNQNNVASPIITYTDGEPVHTVFLSANVGGCLKLVTKQIGYGVGIQTYNEEPELVIYPNPSESDFNLIFALSKQSDVTIRIFNLLGKEIKLFERKTYSKGEHKQEIQISQSGIFILQVAISDVIYYKRVIVK